MSHLSELNALLRQMVDSGCPPLVLSYGFAADAESLMADDLVRFFEGTAQASSEVRLTDVILTLGWHGSRQTLVIDLDCKEFSMIGTLPTELRCIIENIGRGAGYMVTV
jgi:hypothetical protein